MLLATAANIHWNSQGAFFRQSCLYSAIKAPLRQTFPIQPFLQTCGLAIKSNKPITRCIACLFRWRSPSCVIRAIRLVVIYSFDAMSFARAWSHIGIKVLKRIKPSFYNVNAAPTVIFISFFVGVQTSPLHATPHTVFRGVSHAVGPKALRCFFIFKATTTGGISFAQTPTIDKSYCSTCTLTPPLSLPPRTVRPSPQYLPSAKWGEFRQINKFTHDTSYQVRERVDQALSVIGTEAYGLRNRLANQGMSIA